MQWLDDEAHLMEERAVLETEADREMREFNERYQDRMRKVMSSQQSSRSLGTEHWTGSEAEQRGSHPAQRSDVSAARGAVQGQGGESRSRGQDSKGRVPSSIAVESHVTLVSAVSFTESGGGRARGGDMRSQEGIRDRMGDRPASSGGGSTREKVISAEELRGQSQLKGEDPSASHHQLT